MENLVEGTEAIEHPAFRPLPVAPGLPLIGAAREMLSDAPGFVLRTARTLGSTFRIPLGPRTITVIAHPADLKQLLQDNQKDYPRGKLFDPMRPMLGDSLPTADGETWRRKRRTLQPGFNKPKIAKLTDAMSEITRRFADALEDGQRFDCHELMMKVTRDIIVETMLSNQLGSDTQTLDHAFEQLNRWVARYSFVPFSVPLWLPTPDNINFKRARKTFDDLLYGLIEKRQKSGERHNDLLDALLEARYEDGQPMPPTELRDEVAGIYFAGHETSANTLTWCFAELSRNPDVFAKVREEADRVIGDRSPNADDVAKLEYTSMVVREALRLYPAGWMLGRTAMRDANLRGYQVKKGDFVGFSPFVSHRMEEHWPDPDRFDPERFAGDKTNGNRNFTYFPFGAGPHMCIGMHLALAEMQIVVAMFARRANLVVEHPEKIRMTSKLTLQVKGGLPVRVERRRTP